MLSKGELEELRPWVSFRVAAVLGGHNLTVVNLVLDCIGKSLNRQAATGRRTIPIIAHCCSLRARMAWFPRKMMLVVSVLCFTPCRKAPNVHGARNGEVCGRPVQESAGGKWCCQLASKRVKIVPA